VDPVALTRSCAADTVVAGRTAVDLAAFTPPEEVVSLPKRFDQSVPFDCLRRNNSSLIAGFQDNGTQFYAGSNGWSVADGASNNQTGDGGFALFDQINPLVASHFWKYQDRRQ
jgi:hypothetical protein